MESKEKIRLLKDYIAVAQGEMSKLFFCERHNVNFWEFTKIAYTIEAELVAENKRLKEMLVLQQEVGDWANKTFGKTQTVVGVINHLIKEVYELRDSDEPNEAADCLLLLFQHAHECGYDLFEEAKKKHEINLKRKWGKPDKHGVIEHIPPDQALKESKNR